MRKLAQTISWCAVLGTILPSLLYLFGQLELATVHWLMLLATIVWFAVTPLWMGRDLKASDPDSVNAV
jgi:hypothetical protein